MEKCKGSDTPHGMASVEKLNLCPFPQPEFVIQVFHLTILVGHPFVRLYDVIMAAFNHERPGKDEIGHLGIAERTAHVEVGHFPFHGIHESVFEIRVHYFPGPVAKITRADGKAISLKGGGNTHGRFPAIAQPVKGDPVLIHERQGSQPP